MKFITDIKREEICEIIKSSSLLFVAADRIFAGKNKKINFELLLTDYYNTLIMRKQMGTLDNDDIKFLNLVNSHKVEDLYCLTNNLNFLRNVFISTVNFNSLAHLDKHQITNIAYQEKEENDLTKRPLYNINFLGGGLSSNPDELLNYYKEYISINGGDLITHDTARDIIFNHVKHLRQNDIDSYKPILFNAIPVYYKWGKFTLSKYKKEIDATSRKFLRRIEWLKLEDLMEISKRDDEFLFNLITQYLYFETITHEIVDEVEEYYEKKLSKKMKQKLDSMDKNKTTSN